MGQDEVDIASLADSVIVLVAPGMGDAIQAAKAGILEIADLFVVNKADKPDSHQVVRDLRGMIALAERKEGDWKPPIITTVGVNALSRKSFCFKLMPALKRWCCQMLSSNRSFRAMHRKEWRPSSN